MTDPLLLDLATSIETERLLVRVPQAGDGLALHAAVVESLPELRQFLGFLPWVASEPNPKSSEARCRAGAANFLSRTDLPFLAFEKSSGQLLGGVGLHRTVWSTPKTEVGYWVRTSRAGSGYVTEAVSALVEYAFNQMRAVRVELITDEANAPSRQVAERCRFGLEGILRNERRAPDGSLRNTCVYAISQRAPNPSVEQTTSGLRPPDAAPVKR
jgi:RimJ/RimL family protein N-acetyltransferase